MKKLGQCRVIKQYRAVHYITAQCILQCSKLQYSAYCSAVHCSTVQCSAVITVWGLEEQKVRRQEVSKRSLSWRPGVDQW